MNQRNDDMIARGNVVVRGSNSTIRTEELHYDPTRNLASDKPTRDQPAGQCDPRTRSGERSGTHEHPDPRRLRGLTVGARARPAAAARRGDGYDRCGETLALAVRPCRAPLSAVPTVVRAQADDDPVVIDHANELRRVAEGDSLTYFLQGAVRAHRGPIQMRSEQATIFRQSQVADFQRNVHFWDATTEIYADRLLYYEVSNQALATGSVQVIDRRSGSQVAADTVLYERNLGLITAAPVPRGSSCRRTRPVRRTLSTSGRTS